MARTIENEGMLMKVTLEARTVTMVMKTKRGDASNWKGFKLSQHTNPRLRQRTNDEAKTDKATNVEPEVTRPRTLEVMSDETMNMESMQTNMKIKETIWHEIRILY